MIQHGVFSLAVAEWAAIRFSLVVLVVENLPANAGDRGLIPGWGRSAGGENGNPSQSSCLGNFHVQRSLVDYSPGVLIELDMTEAIENKLAKEWCIHGREKEIDKKKKPTTPKKPC